MPAILRNGYNSVPRALILDRRAVMGTEMCRSLARRGCAVDVLGAASSPAFYSRFCARRFSAPPCESGEPFRALVGQVIRDTRYDAIFICNEDVLEAIMSVPGYQDWPGLVLSPPAVLRTALSKFAMLRVAAEAGVTVPRAIFPRDESELPALATELGFPLIIKGDRGESGSHVRLVDGPARLIGAYREVAALEPTNSTQGPLVQEYVKGIAYSVGGLFHKGRPLRVAVHRKLLAVPPLGGLTVRGRTERPSGLLESAFKIFAAIEYTGLGHLEMIQDREGRFNFLEINPRAWGTIGIAEYAGVDFFTAYLQLARGAIPKPDLHFLEGVTFHRMGREGKLIRARPTRIAGFLRDCLDPRLYSDFEWFDPAPHIFALARRRPDSASTIGPGWNVRDPRPN